MAGGADIALQMIMSLKDEASAKLAALGAAAEKADKKAGTLSETFGKLAGVGRGVLLGGLGVATGAIAGLTVGLVSAGKAAAEEQTGIAKLGAAVSATGADWNKASGAIEDYLTAELKRTALDDGDGREAISRLTQATGDYRKALELMPLAQDLARAKGMDLANASEIVGKVAAGNTGILSRYGITLEKGASAQEALAEMQSRFAGQAEAYGKTVEGSQARMRIAFGNVKETIGGVVLPVLATLAETFSGLAVDALPLVEQAVGTLGNAITAAMPAIKSALEDAKILFLWFLDAGRLLLAGDLEGAISTAFEGVFEVFGSFGGKLQQVRDIVLNVVGFVKDHFEIFKRALIALGAVLAGAAIASGIMSIVGAIMALANPITLVIGAVVLLYTAWSQNWGGIQDKTKAVIDWLRGFIEPFLQNLQYWWFNHGDEIMAKVKAMWESVKEFFTDGFYAVKGFVEEALQNIKLWWFNHGDEVMDRINKLWADAKAAFSAAFAFLQDLVSTVLATIKSWWSDHGQLVMNILQLLWDNVKTLFETAFEVLESLVQAVIAAFKGDWTRFSEELRDIVDALWKLVATAFRNAWTILTTIVGEIVSDIKRTFTDIDWGEVGRNIISGVANGINSAVDWIVDAAKSAANAAYEAAKGFLGIKSPSQLMADEVGEPFVLGIVAGIEAAMPALNATMQAVAKDVNAFAAQVQDAVNPKGGGTPRPLEDIEGPKRDKEWKAGIKAQRRGARTGDLEDITGRPPPGTDMEPGRAGKVPGYWPATPVVVAPTLKPSSSGYRSYGGGGGGSSAKLEKLTETLVAEVQGIRQGVQTMLPAGSLDLSAQVKLNQMLLRGA